MPLPLGFIAPCLPTKAPQPPTGEGWLHEFKKSTNTKTRCSSRAR
jgi:hypothetical protein